MKEHRKREGRTVRQRQAMAQQLDVFAGLDARRAARQLDLFEEKRPGGSGENSPSESPGETS
jgi:hypothetical protein